MRSQTTMLAALLFFCPATVDVANNAAANDRAGRDLFAKLPAGWQVERSIVVADSQLAAFSRKLGGQIGRVSNTFLAVAGQQLQVNVVACQTDAGSAKVFDTLLASKQGNRDVVLRDGRSVVEFIGESRLVRRAHYELGFKPRRVIYRVSFQAAPLEEGDPMGWNALYNAFLAGDAGAGRVTELSAKFKFRFGNQMAVKKFGQGAEPSRFTFDPKPRTEAAGDTGELTRVTFADLPRERGVPRVAVVATVTSEAFAWTPSLRTASPELVGPNAFWPSEAPEIVALTMQITAGKQNREEQVAALLDWFMPGKNIRFGGPVMGSRYGVQKVLQQKFGHCWDFSDAFIALARAAGIPSRQVVGWLHGGEGHIWAEVLIEGQGWRAVDPTAGMGCGSDYIPLFTLEDGRMPVVYTSMVKTEIIGR